MKKKRRPLELEQLEARETPDVSLRPAAAYPLPLLPANLDKMTAAPAGKEQSPVLGAPAAAEQPAAQRADLTPVQALSSQALETLFLNPGELTKLLAGLGTREQETGLSSGPQAGAPSAEAATQGWQFLCNYTRKAIHNEELKYGSLPDHEDILHQVFVEWRQQVGPQEQTLSDLLQRDSAERQVLRKAVRRVLDQVRYELARQRRTAALFDQPAPVKAGEQEWRDLQLDWATGVGRLGPRERQLLELRRQGMTFEEIGSAMGLARQRVFEVYHAAVGRLRALYSTVDSSP